MSDISNSAKIIDVSDITDRVDKLRAEREGYADQYQEDHQNEDGEVLDAGAAWAEDNTDDAEELARLLELLGDLKNCGSSEHSWDGNHYPQTLIADHHFPDYAQEFAEDCGEVKRGVSWIVIDWAATAEWLKQDYSEVNYDGATYWYR